MALSLTGRGRHGAAGLVQVQQESTSQRPGQPLPLASLAPAAPMASRPPSTRSAASPHLDQDLQILGSVTLSVSKALLLGGGLARGLRKESGVLGMHCKSGYKSLAGAEISDVERFCYFRKNDSF